MCSSVVVSYSCVVIIDIPWLELLLCHLPFELFFNSLQSSFYPLWWWQALLLHSSLSLWLLLSFVSACVCLVRGSGEERSWKNLIFFFFLGWLYFHGSVLPHKECCVWREIAVMFHGLFCDSNTLADVQDCGVLLLASLSTFSLL